MVRTRLLWRVLCWATLRRPFVAVAAAWCATCRRKSNRPDPLASAAAEPLGGAWTLDFQKDSKKSESR